MSYALTSVVLNGQAVRAAGLLHWTASRAAIVSDGYNGNTAAFKISSMGFMKQSVPPIRMDNVTPIDFRLRIAHRVSAIAPLQTIAASIRIDVVYASAVDTYIYPLLLRHTKWTELTDILFTTDGDDYKIQRIDVSIVNNSPYDVYVDTVHLFPNTTSIEGASETTPMDSSKMIMYGLEADLPILR